MRWRGVRDGIETRFDRLILLVSLSVALWQVLYVPLIPFSEARIRSSGDIPKVREQAIALYKDRVQNLISVAIGLAAAATLGAYNRWSNRRLPERLLRVLRSCWTCAGLSIFSGLIGLYQLQRLLQRHLATTDVPIVAVPAGVQLVALFGAVPFLITFLVRAFGDNNAEPKLS